MSVEEKIRRAEEIYNRRNYQNNYTYRSSSREKKKPTLMNRMIKRLIVCFIIYGVFYMVENRDYYLSEEFRNQVQEIVPVEIVVDVLGGDAFEGSEEVLDVRVVSVDVVYMEVYLSSFQDGCFVLLRRL